MLEHEFREVTGAMPAPFFLALEQERERATAKAAKRPVDPGRGQAAALAMFPEEG